MNQAQLLHLVDRVRRGVILPAEIDNLHHGIEAIHAQAAELEQRLVLAMSPSTPRPGSARICICSISQTCATCTA